MVQLQKLKRKNDQFGEHNTDPVKPSVWLKLCDLPELIYSSPIRSEWLPYFPFKCANNSFRSLLPFWSPNHFCGVAMGYSLPRVVMRHLHVPVLNADKGRKYMRIVTRQRLVTWCHRNEYAAQSPTTSTVGNPPSVHTQERMSSW